MEYYRSPADCPNRDKLAKMTPRQASAWCMTASTHSGEISRRAQVQAFYGLTPTQERELYESVLDEPYPEEPGAEGLPQLVIPGAEAIPQPNLTRKAMKPQRHDMPEGGLFDDGARAQLTLF
jgi:hypothetical protein